MPRKPDISLQDLINRRFDALGLQFAHIIGVAFYGSPQLAWLEPLLSVGEDANFTVLPETERGSAILGVAAHLGFQNSAFDKFFQDGVNGYAVGAGFTGIFAPQGELALEFYSNVTDQSFENKDMRELVW